VSTVRIVVVEEADLGLHRPASTAFAIGHVETMVTRDEGGRGAITNAAGLWGDEGLWWQRPRKLGGGVCICEEHARNILHGRKGDRLAAS